MTTSPTGRPGPGDPLAAAREVASALARDAAARDAAGSAPLAEVALLRESGLLALLVPRELGGAGESWETVLSAVRVLAAADASAAMLLGYHHLHLWRLGHYGNADLAERAARGTAREGWFWGGASNPRDPGLTLVPDGDGYRVRGRKGFATGAQVADRIVVSGDAGGGKVMVVVDGRDAGVRHADDWDALGVRRSASGSVAFEDARVPAGWVVGRVPPDEESARPDQSLVVPGFQAVFVHLYTGIAQGALAAAAEYTRTRSRPWTGSGVESASLDPYVLETYGDMAAQVAAADALAERARAAFGRAVARGRDLTARERGEAALAVSAAKVVAQRAVLDVTATIFEVMGARATAAGAGFDRYWRDARTHTLHDPIAYKLREVGDHALNGRLPTPGPYS
ncbi:acyl-CoA dehydrogenase family protein [Microbispora corallina]|uniref:Dibenzothiophene monooxygenase n=1 Tax=Microbispora corallina TaxID=83302 RepID=A0ABQ4FRA6_9ACTN|nr:acyl-CoA dehydrogenase family protein [Microbispora corallina]GIH37340.1 monooxygenase [Microbispora corallina]